MRKHLAIFSDEAVKQILAGEKIVETRFSQKKIPPFGEVSVGDFVYVKPSGKEIVGQFRVEKVISIEGVDATDLKEIEAKYGSPGQKFFESHKGAKYGTIIFIGNFEQFITSPVKIKKSDLRGWVVLD